MMLSFAILNADDFVRKCQNIYFPIDGYSSADFIIMHATLICFLRNTSDSDLQYLGLSRSAALATLTLCQKNIDAAAERLSVFLQPCIDNIQALMLAVSCIWKPVSHLTRTLISPTGARDIRRI